MKHIRMITTSPGLRLLRSVLIGILGGTAVCAGLLLLAAAAIQSSGNLPQDLLQPMILAICGVSSFFAGLLAAKASGKRGLLFGAGCGLLLFVVCLVGSAANSHEVFSVSALTRMLVMILAGALGGYLAMCRRQKIR